MKIPIDWELTLRYLDVFIWPITALIIAFFFRAEVRSLINRISSAELPGGVKLSLPPSQKLPTKDIEEIKESVGQRKEEGARESSFAEGSVTLKTLQEQIKVLLEQIAALQTALVFERVYQNIFGSQIKLLDALREVGVQGILYENVAAFYQATRKTWSTLSSYSLNQYLNYLVNAGLVEIIQEGVTKKCKITSQGVDFLEYIEKLNYTKNKSF